MSKPPTATDVESRRVILEAAAQLLDAGGAEGLTIRKLSNDSGYTPPAIYALFGDKAGLVDALIERAFEDLLDRLRDVRHSGDGRDYVRRAFHEIVRFGREHHWHFRLLEERFPGQAASLPSVERARELMREPLVALANSADSLPHDLELVRQVFWALLHGLIALPPTRPDVEWRENLSEVAFDALLDGLLGVNKSNPQP